MLYNQTEKTICCHSDPAIDEDATAHCRCGSLCDTDFLCCVTWTVTALTDTVQWAAEMIMCVNLCCPCVRISTEHSPKLQIRSHSYLRAVSEVSINRSLDTLDPKTLLDPKSLLSSPQYRSRNESYMRAMSTISQVGCQHHCLCIHSLLHPVTDTLAGLDGHDGLWNHFHVKWSLQLLVHTWLILMLLHLFVFSLFWFMWKINCSDIVRRPMDQLYFSLSLFLRVRVTVSVSAWTDNITQHI